MMDDRNGQAVLAIDVGNSEIEAALLQNGERIASERFATAPCRDRSTLTENLAKFLGSVPEGEMVRGSIYSSVVPAVAKLLPGVLRKLTGKMCINAAEAALRVVPVKDYDQTSLGTDRLVDAAAAVALYGAPCAVYDLGTAATLSVVDREGYFIGGMISPGVQTSLDTLAARTAQLPQFRAEAPTQLIGNDTRSCMVGGAVIGTAAMIDGVMARVREEVAGDGPFTAVLTGGLSGLVYPWTREKFIHVPELQIHGLAALFMLEADRESTEELHAEGND